MGGNVFRPRPTSGKREKQAFGRGRKLEIAETPPVARKRNAESLKNWPSLVSETQNYPISARRSQAKRRITQKLAVARKRNTKSPIFYVSNPLEKQNHSFSAFPTPWKVRIAHFLRFQPLGKAKSLIFCVSNPLESQNRPFSAFPTPWKVKNAPKTARRRPTKRKIIPKTVFRGSPTSRN